MTPSPAARAVESGEQPGGRFIHGRHAGQQIRRREALRLFLGKIHGKTHAGAQVFQRVAQGGHARPEQTVQPGRRQPRPFPGRSGDHFGHGFGLRQIHAAVEKGAAGELPAFRRARPGRQNGFQQRLEQRRAAVTMPLGHILARERARAGHENRQNIVDPPAFLIKRGPPVQRPGAKIPKHRRSGREARAKNGARERPAHPDDSDASAPRRSGDGGDGVLHGAA